MKKIYIKNMVCERCIRVVREELNKIGMKIYSIDLGEVTIENDPDDKSIELIKKVLSENGFELLEDRKSRIIESIKTLVIEKIHKSETLENLSFTEIIQNELKFDYSYLSSLFSSIENMTIEQFIILQKIEKAKELIKYNELTLSEIAFKLGYSSVQHLSNQFKKMTGMTATEFKKNTLILRIPLDKLSDKNKYSTGSVKIL